MDGRDGFLYHVADWSILDWLHHVYPALQGKWRPRECIQKPGDTFYLPEGWYHAVVNLADSVGISLQQQDLIIESVRLEFEANHINDKSKQATLWQCLVKLQPGNLEAQLQLFQATKNLQPKRALCMISETVQNDPFQVDVQYALANYFAEQHASGDEKTLQSLANVLNICRPYLENNTRNLRANHLLSQFYLLRGMKDKGIKYLRRNAALDKVGIRDQRLKDVKLNLQKALQA